MVKDFTRSITHSFKHYSSYNRKVNNKKGNLSAIVEKKIYSKDILKYEKGLLSKVSKNRYVDDNFIWQKYDKWGTTFIAGGVSLGFLLIILRHAFKEGFSNSYVFFILIFSIIILFFVIYSFTQPKKEQILNRRDGLITMTGFFWQKNITMRFDDVIFVFSSGGEDVVGGYQLMVLRPTIGADIFELTGNCYTTMSFITWYMDKNRPLPPGEAFDRFREQDFERRKAEGFPKPLYPSKIKTPEATKAQQAERKRIGGW
ncbi:hypothetical protein JAO71_03750 [Olleya sp. YSTF-M6]|uniref:Transmembrane protein n=1 Tax=Olleya sediminilitoris TaxID=2795739 RepID=A0ABS1WIF4_9FLAO|nr:hypothetical protein [Olleya sediminilitoris]MBL7558909.1 hypothetical protein [Olleya sediminilitoris]